MKTLEELNEYECAMQFAVQNTAFTTLVESCEMLDDEQKIALAAKLIKFSNVHLLSKELKQNKSVAIGLLEELKHQLER